MEKKSTQPGAAAHAAGAAGPSAAFVEEADVLPAVQMSAQMNADPGQGYFEGAEALAATPSVQPVQPVQNVQNVQNVQKREKVSLLLRLGAQWGVDHRELYSMLAKTCFRKSDGTPPSKEEMMSLLIIADQAGLNPMLGEIYAFPGKNGGIVPIVGINGWRKIAAANPEYAGVRFEFSKEKTECCGISCCEYVKCIVTRRRRIEVGVGAVGAFGEVGEVGVGLGRTANTAITANTAGNAIETYASFESEGYAFFEEKFRNTDPWKQQPRQMLMNKAQIQALKNTFPSLSALYDEDEGRDASRGSVYRANASSSTYGNRSGIGSARGARAMSSTASSASSASSSSAAGSGPALSPPRSSSPSSVPVWTREKLEHQMQKVSRLALSRNEWGLATEWVMKNTRGRDREFALEYLANSRNSENSGYSGHAASSPSASSTSTSSSSSSRSQGAHTVPAVPPFADQTPDLAASNEVDEDCRAREAEAVDGREVYGD